mmetsp:Transcript_32179/g.46767  ORF Transcript_32179/g.46767 Transcript_32179/m.46767 type:complete len:256 (-) Transcript_32179:2304-3071(-)
MTGHELGKLPETPSFTVQTTMRRGQLPAPVRLFNLTIAPRQKRDKIRRSFGGQQLRFRRPTQRGIEFVRKARVAIDAVGKARVSILGQMIARWRGEYPRMCDVAVHACGRIRKRITTATATTRTNWGAKPGSVIASSCAATVHNPSGYNARFGKTITNFNPTHTIIKFPRNGRMQQMPRCCCCSSRNSIRGIHHNGFCSTLINQQTVHRCRLTRTNVVEFFIIICLVAALHFQRIGPQSAVRCWGGMINRETFIE